MKTILLFTLGFLCILPMNAQQIIKGKVTDPRKEPIVGANVYIKNTYSGTTTDSLGQFKLSINKPDSNKLIISFTGYKTFEKKIKNIALNQHLIVKLKESTNNINSVNITAGAFEASDEKKSITMRPLDIVTTASSTGDIYGAINTMPGTQKVGEEGGLYVRGGEGYEAKTYMDGMLVQKPYSSSMPDVPSRGRFSPFMFNGTIFSTGGYSAEYGQALSSALILNTKALANENISSISLLSVGLGVSHTKRWDKTSLTLNADYQNLSPYYSLVKQNLDWKKAPENIGGNLIFRQKVRKNGIIKSFASFSKSESKLNNQNYEQDKLQLIKLLNNNAYFNTVYKDMLTDKLTLKIGIAYNYNTDNINIDSNKVITKENSIQSLINFKYFVNDNFSIKIGSEIYQLNYKQDYYSFAEAQTYKTNFENTIYSSFAETEIKLSSKFAARIGSRFEYYSLTTNYNLSPRISLAFKTGKYNQISLAHGYFYQMAQNDYLKFKPDLKPEKAIHYIANYQYNKSKRTFRLEVYYKDYIDLVKYQSFNLPNKNTYNNKGYGYAKGLDIFWRDRKTFPLIDYRISYSYLDTRRDFLNYPKLANPSFTSKHNFSAVCKYWISKINTMLGLSYTYSSGRTYNNPNNPEFLADKTKDYHDLSMNASYLTKIFGNQAIIHLSISNILGINNIYSYRYNSQMNENHVYEAYPVKPTAKRFAVLVFMLSIK